MPAPLTLSPFKLHKNTKLAATVVFVWLCLAGTLQKLTVLTNSDTARSDNSTHLVDLPKPDLSRPRLRSILSFTPTNGTSIIGDPQWLLDFAIIGFPKCGTTALQEWLSQHSEIAMLPSEVFSLTNHAPERLIYRLYTQLPANRSIKRGYKNPLEIRAPHSLDYLAKYFPKTLLIVGIRHPIVWMESLYNFKVQNLPRQVHPSYWGDPNELIGKCYEWNDTNCVGTAKGYFYLYLATLGKVPFPSSWSTDHPLYFSSNRLTRRLPNPIFLYESRQLSDSNRTRASQFRKDLQQVLHLNSTLLPMTIHTKPDFTHFTSRQQHKRNKYKIRICDDRYRYPLRHHLLQVARMTSEWIRSEFVHGTTQNAKNNDVYISSPEYFEQLLQDWMMDPCDVMSSSDESNTNKDHNVTK